MFWNVHKKCDIRHFQSAAHDILLQLLKFGVMWRHSIIIILHPRLTFLLHAFDVVLVAPRRGGCLCVNSRFGQLRFWAQKIELSIFSLTHLFENKAKRNIDLKFHHLCNAGDNQYIRTTARACRVKGKDVYGIDMDMSFKQNGIARTVAFPCLESKCSAGINDYESKAELSQKTFHLRCLLHHK